MNSRIIFGPRYVIIPVFYDYYCDRCHFVNFSSNSFDFSWSVSRFMLPWYCMVAVQWSRSSGNYSYQIPDIQSTTYRTPLAQATHGGSLGVMFTASRTKDSWTHVDSEGRSHAIDVVVLFAPLSSRTARVSHNATLLKKVSSRDLLDVAFESDGTTFRVVER